MASQSAIGESAPVAPVQLGEKPGWDTFLATPFRDLQRLPPVFQRLKGERAFVAATPTSIHRIGVGEPGVAEFIAEPRDDQGDRYHHELGFSTWPGHLSVRTALATAFKRLNDAYDAGESTVDISSLLRFMGELPSRVALISEGQSVEPTALQWFGFETIREARGGGGYYPWFCALGEPTTIGQFDGLNVNFDHVLCLGVDLPHPLNTLTPTYEVISLDEDGISTWGIHPALLRVDAKPNIVEEIKACRDLSDEAVAELREFATRGIGWIAEW